MNVVDVLVAEFRESIRPVILEIVFLLTDMRGVNALLKLLEHGKVSKFLTFIMLM